MPNKMGWADYLTPREVADELGVHINTVYTLCNNGDLKSFKIGARRRIRAEALIAFIERQEQEANNYDHSNA